MSVSPRCSCYHEAGHSVAWVVNGDHLVIIKGYRNAPMGASQEKLYYGCIFGKEGDFSSGFREGHGKERYAAGTTIVQVADHLCICGGCIRCTSLYPVKAGFSLNEDCSGCMKLFANHLACSFAGGAATECLLSNEHIDGRSKDDHAAAKDLLERVIGREQIRENVCWEAKQEAYAIVRREAKAVEALASALLECGVLNGPDAEKIVRENLLIAT
jgi:hypothetical protein